jgi:hypothetical protein
MIFIDRSMTKPVARTLRQHRDDVVWLEDVFEHNTKDEDWLSDVGDWGWLVICRDKGIRHHLRAKLAIKEHNVGCFILGQTEGMKKQAIVEAVLEKLPEMERRFAELERPFLFLIDKQGAFRPVALP